MENATKTGHELYDISNGYTQVVVLFLLKLQITKIIAELNDNGFIPTFRHRNQKNCNGGKKKTT